MLNIGLLLNYLNRAATFPIGNSLMSVTESPLFDDRTMVISSGLSFVIFLFSEGRFSIKHAYRYDVCSLGSRGSYKRT